MLVASVAAIAWGALAFAAVYPWAYTPLAVVCAIAGIAGLAATRGARPPIGALAACSAAVATAIVLQLIPLSPDLLARVSPATPAFLSQYDLGYFSRTAVSGSSVDAAPLLRPISIAPERTRVGLMLFSAFALFMLGLTAVFSHSGARGFALAVLALAILLALVAVVQAAANPRGHSAQVLIYGFWQPRFPSVPFGPFVNPNHFGGWMLMALPLVLGLFYGTLDARIRGGSSHVGPLLRSPDAGVLMLSGFAVVPMGVALMMTRSRSALVCFAAIGVLSTWAVVRRQAGRAAKTLAVAGGTALVVGTMAWAGLDTVLWKFTADAELGSGVGRLSAWRDTVAIARDFPWTGSGINTFGTAMMVYQTGDRLAHFRESHNDYLQIAAEGGGLVGLPIAATLVVFVRDVRRRFREAPKSGTTYWLRIGAVIGMLAIALQSLVEFSLQMPGNAAFFAALAAVALHRSPRLAGAPTRVTPASHPKAR